MSMLQVHADALSDELPVYHEFLARYKKNSMSVYGFVEGKEDPSFYRGKIEDKLPESWSVDLWAAGNRKNVIDLHRSFDWTRFSKHRIVFFIDRDLSDFLAEKLPRDINMYITDKYSIENSIVSRITCDRVLTEVCNISSIEKSDKDKILDLFEKQLTIFQKKMIPLMAWIICWKRNNLTPSLNNIHMNHLFSVDATGKLKSLNSPKNFSTLEEYIHNQCQISFPFPSKITAISKEFKKLGGPNKFIRGKYELWFLVAFVLSIHKNIHRFSTQYNRPPKISVSFSHANAVILIAPRARIPATLKTFLGRTHMKYAQEFTLA